MTIFEISNYLKERGFKLEDTLCEFALKDTRLFFMYHEAQFCTLSDGLFIPYIIKPATEYNSKYLYIIFLFF